MAEAPGDDLDQLLDSALDDFSKLDLAPTHRSDGVGGVPSSAAVSSSADGAKVEGLGMGLPDLKARRKGKQQHGGPPRGSHASEAFEQLARETREAVRGLESATGTAAVPGEGTGGMDKEAMVDDLVKQFAELTESQDMESIVETMMQQLLSKEILHEPMKEIGERYPKWLEEHKSGLSPEDYERYHHQYELIIELNEVYEKDPNNFTVIVNLMQKMQECGQPPNDIVQELAPDLDLTNFGSQMFPELAQATPECSVM